MNIRIGNLSYCANVENGMIWGPLPWPTPGVLWVSCLRWLFISRALSSSILFHIVVSLTLHAVKLWLRCPCMWCFRRFRYSLFYNKGGHPTIGKNLPSFLWGRPTNQQPKNVFCEPARCLTLWESTWKCKVWLCPLGLNNLGMDKNMPANS